MQNTNHNIICLYQLHARQNNLAKYSMNVLITNFIIYPFSFMQRLAYVICMVCIWYLDKIEEGSDNQWKLLGTQTKWLYDPVVGQKP